MRLLASSLLCVIACASTTPPEPQTVHVDPPEAIAEAGALPIAPPQEPPPAVEPSAPEPPAQPAAPTPRFVASKKFPHTIYAATVDTSKAAWSVDIADWDLEPESELAINVQGREEILELPGGLAPLPEGWDVGDAWTLVTKRGTVARKVTGYGLSMSGGSGETFVHVLLGAAPSGAKGPALAVRGHSKAKLDVPKSLRPAAIGASTLDAIRDAMVAGFDEESKSLMRRAKLRDGDVQIFPGHFPGGRTHVVFVSHTTGSSDDQTTLSAMLFVGKDGKLEFFRQADVLGEMTFVALGDLDGDATDEILFEDAYHEGWYVELVHWAKSKPKVRVLTGDGV
jgi:hypothetical protein